MKTIKRKLKKLLYKLGQILIYIGKPDTPFGDIIRGSKEEYLSLANEANKRSFIEIEEYENKTGFAIDKDWINDLALHTQIVKKKSRLNFSHGRVLYSTLCDYIRSKTSIISENNINILETGTARGFSSLCMAKALQDCDSFGSILTFDLIPNEQKMYWNCIDDVERKKTRLELLKKWKTLVEKYLIFIEGDTRMNLPAVSVQRVNFAFLDGAHTYDDVMFEFFSIKEKQLQGDMIVYDDYNNLAFPGIVKAVDEICSLYGYSRIDIMTEDERGYVIAKKI